MRILATLALLRPLRRAEQEIGYALNFRDIPDFWINGLIRCDMTRTWRTFGLNILRGANYFTVGEVVDNNSSRFDSSAPQYQSWLGGYTVRMERGQQWTLQDHLNLAVADQRSWLRRYGDPEPVCEFPEADSRIVGSIEISGYSGTLYEGTCTTHSDVGNGFSRAWLKISSVAMAGAFNISNAALKVRGGMLRPQHKESSYEALKLKGYIALFDIEDGVKVVLYGNGTAGHGDAAANTFEVLKGGIRRAMESCEIIKI